MTIYEQAVELMYKAHFPEQAAWKIPPSLQSDLLLAEDVAGEKVVTFYNRQYFMFGYPVDITEAVTKLTLDVIEPKHTTKTGPGETKTGG